MTNFRQCAESWRVGVLHRSLLLLLSSVAMLGCGNASSAGVQGTGGALAQGGAQQVGGSSGGGGASTTGDSSMQTTVAATGTGGKSEQVTGSGGTSAQSTSGLTGVGGTSDQAIGGAVSGGGAAGSGGVGGVTGSGGIASTGMGGSAVTVSGGISSTGTTGSSGSSTGGMSAASDAGPDGGLAGRGDIMIILDRSFSMTDDVNGSICTGGSLSGDGNCGTSSKWYQTITAVQAVVKATQDSVNWGLYWMGNESTQCGASTTPAVSITSGPSYLPIESALNRNEFTGQIGTPTAAVVNNAVAYLQTLSDTNPKFLLLVTDGEPNCANGNVNAIDSTGLTAAVNSARIAGIETFVVGIATATVASVTTALNSAAVAGGHPLTGTAVQYYATFDTQGTEAALSMIVGIVTET